MTEYTGNKYCAGCKFSFKRVDMGLRCYFGAASDSKTSNNPVYGKIEVNHLEKDCGEVRYDESLCGLEGKFYKADLVYGNKV